MYEPLPSIWNKPRRFSMSRRFLKASCEPGEDRGRLCETGIRAINGRPTQVHSQAHSQIHSFFSPFFKGFFRLVFKITRSHICICRYIYKRNLKYFSRARRGKREINKYIFLYSTQGSSRKKLCSCDLDHQTVARLSRDPDSPRCALAQKPAFWGGKFTKFIQRGNR